MKTHNPTPMKWYPYLKLDKAPFPLPSHQDIKALEDALGLRFPATFSEALEQHQGMVPERYIAPVGENGDEPLGCLYHVFMDNRQPGYSIKGAFDQLQEDGVPETLVPFSDAGNSFFCLDFSKSNDCPSVMLLRGDYELTDPRSKVTLADSFEEFLGTLEGDDDDDDD